MLLAVVISIHPLIAYGVGAVPILLATVYFAVRPVFRRVKTGRIERRARIQSEEMRDQWLKNAKKHQERLGLEGILTSPWLKVWDAISELNNYKDRLRKLHELINGRSLHQAGHPAISEAACEKLATKASKAASRNGVSNNSDPEYKLAMTWLKPFLAPKAAEPSVGEK